MQRSRCTCVELFRTSQGQAQDAAEIGPLVSTAADRLHDLEPVTMPSPGCPRTNSRPDQRDGTNWYKTHSSLNWSGFNAESALRFGDQAPYFPIEPGRVYVGWVWCFVEGDAHGADATSAAFAQAQIDATVNMIVVGQQ